MGANAVLITDAAIQGAAHRRIALSGGDILGSVTYVQLDGMSDHHGTVCCYPTIPPDCFFSTKENAQDFLDWRQAVREKYHV